MTKLKKMTIVSVVFSIICVSWLLCMLGVGSVVVRTFLHATKPGIYFKHHKNVTNSPVATLVTAYFEIDSKHTSRDYDIWMKNMFSLTDPMVIFTEEKFVTQFLALRSHAANKTRIITTRLEHLKVAQMYTRDTWAKQLWIDPEKNLHKTYKVYWIWLNKLSFMAEAVQMNPFDNDIFVWCDVGSFRDNTYNHAKLLVNMDLIDENRMLLMAVKPPHNTLQNNGMVLKYDAYFENSDWYTGGGIIAGYKNTITITEKLFVQTIAKYKENQHFIGDDQPLLQFTCVKHDMCEFVTPYHIPGNPWFGLQYALHTSNVISLWKPRT